MGTGGSATVAGVAAGQHRRLYTSTGYATYSITALSTITDCIAQAIFEKIQMEVDPALAGPQVVAGQRVTVLRTGTAINDYDDTLARSLSLRV
eukprot:3880090-Rhodomonas_salina.1